MGTPDSEIVIRPDEARTLAEDDKDPSIANQLRKVAATVETALTDERFADL
jgi:hypothetical protein